VVERRQDELAAYNAEHVAAWVFALTALTLGTIGLLRGFGVVGDSGDVANSVTQDGAGEAIAALSAPGNFLDGIVWLLPALAAGMLAYALHRNEHHLGVLPDALADRHEGMFKTEHGLAMVMTLGTIALGAVAILVGFDVFDRGNDQADGMLWGIASVGAGMLTAALHGVRHHQFAPFVESTVDDDRGRRVEL
jgi:hypothetical protein